MPPNSQRPASKRYMASSMSSPRITSNSTFLILALQPLTLIPQAPRLGLLCCCRHCPRLGQHRQALNEHYPIIVFSKSYCPYSKRAKKLLSRYDIQPEPKIVEVDLRDDADVIKTILTRLTGVSTFPNIIVHGKSIGGSDDLQLLHYDGSLTTILQKAGAVVKFQGDEK
ncbi:thioredoxin-like protein [Cyathus striatus]|nr:thioredoxin-like protein [Cyathus striatus]